MGLLISLLLWALPLQGVSRGNDSPSVAEEQMKAVYLYNFLQFVTWPLDHASGDTPSTKVIGLLGDSNISKTLAELGANLAQKKQGSIQIKFFGNYAEGLDLSTCHLLFVGASERQNFTRIITSLKHAPVLTVSDVHSFQATGGMITLQKEQNRIRYHINQKEATAAGLRLSSQLLKTAIEVTGE